MLRGHQAAVCLLAAVATLDACSASGAVARALRRLPPGAGALPDDCSFLQVELQVAGAPPLDARLRNTASNGTRPEPATGSVQTQPLPASLVVYRALSATGAGNTLLMVCIIIAVVGVLSCCVLTFQFGPRDSSAEAAKEMAAKDPFLKVSPKVSPKGSQRELESMSEFDAGVGGAAQNSAVPPKMLSTTTRSPLVAYDPNAEVLCPELVAGKDEEVTLIVEGPLHSQPQEQIITVSRVACTDHPVMRVILSEHHPDGGACVETAMDMPIAFLATAAVLYKTTKYVQIWPEVYTGDPRQKPFATVESIEKGFHFVMKAKGKPVLNMYRTTSDVMNVYNSKGLVATVDERSRDNRHQSKMQVASGCDVSLVVCALVASHKLR